MRVIVAVSCLALALSARQKPADVYQDAIARYVADDASTAFDLLRPLQPRGIQDAVEASVSGVVKGDGSEAAHPWWDFHTVRVPTDDLQWLRAAVRQ